MSPVVTAESQINRHSAIIHWYSQWADQSGVFSPTVVNLLNSVRAHRSTPMITWEPWLGPPVSKNPYPLKQIAVGAFDGYIDTWATGLAAYGHPVLIRFAHEMQGNWYPWGAGVNGNTPADYIAAFRHVHDRFALNGARTVQWVFGADGDPYGSFPALSNFYPGDAYVDWLGAEAYNWGTTQSWSSWKSFRFDFGLAYSRLAALSPSKPIMIPEIGTVEQGGIKAAWVQEAGADMRRYFPRLRAIVWFSENGTALNTSAAALAAERAVFGAAPFCSTLPY
jgi:beta-mannanase